MKLLVIVLCLLSERFLTHITSHHRFQWFNDYISFLHSKFPNINNFLLFLLAIIPIPLAIFVIVSLLAGLLFGILAFILHLVIFYYCLGPENPFYPIRIEENSISTDTENYLVHVNSQLFSVIFWYLVLGPVAIVTYRIIYMSQMDHKFGHISKTITNLLEWVPARMTAFLYLLVGNFQAAIKDYVNLFFKEPAANAKILSVCGIKALGETELEERLPRAEMLVEHAVIVLLVLMAFITIAAKL